MRVSSLSVCVFLVLMASGCIGGAPDVDPGVPSPPPPKKCRAFGPEAQDMALQVDFQGVWRSPNPHSKVPAGAAKYAENLVNADQGVATPVSGQRQMAGEYEQPDERLSSGVSFDGCNVEHTSGVVRSMYVRDAGVSDSVAMIAEEVSPPPGIERLPFAEAGRSLFVATSDGVKVLANANTTLVSPGAPVPYPVEVLVDDFLPDGFVLQPGETAAYRSTIVRTDANGVEMESVPSSRIVVINSKTEPETYTLRGEIPQEVAPGDRFRLYRTSAAPVDVGAGDEMYLVHEHSIPPFVFDYSVQDKTPDEARGRALYTNATSEGLMRQNERPPFAKDLVSFDGALFALNVRGPQRLSFRFLALPQVNDRILIAGEEFRAIAAGGAEGSDRFVISDSPSLSVALAETAQSLVRSINKNVFLTDTLRSFYASSDSDPPGIVGLEAIDSVVPVYSVVALTDGSIYEPVLSSEMFSTAVDGSDEAWVSRRNGPYAFPPSRSAVANYRFKIGNSGREIMKGVKLRESLIVFVQDDGVYKVRRTGAESWRVDQINQNANLVSAASVAVVDNQVLALTTRGLVAVDEQGVEEIDLPIKGEMRRISRLDPAVLNKYAFAVQDEARLRYIFWHPMTNASTVADHAWIYNVENGTWTERTDAATGGFVSKNDGKLYLGSPDSPTVTQERVGNDTERLQGPSGEAIPVRIDWTVMDEGDAGREKQYTDLRLLTREAIDGPVTFVCTNDLGGSESCTGSAANTPFCHIWVPDGCQRTTRLDVSVRRDVLGQDFEVVGMKSLIVGMYDGAMKR